MKKGLFFSLVLVLVLGGVWAQDASDSSSANSIMFNVEVSYMTQGGTRRAATIVVQASDPREAEREAEAEFKRTNSRSTFIRAVAQIPVEVAQNRVESREPAPSADRAVSPSPAVNAMYSVEVTSMTQGGTRRADTIVVQASDPRAAEREAEAEFKRTNSRSTFIRAVAK